MQAQLKSCPRCAASNEFAAQFCFSCGLTLQKKSNRWAVILILAGFAIFATVVTVGVIAAYKKPGIQVGGSSRPSSSGAVDKIEPARRGVTMAQYNQLQSGMTYSQAVDLLGSAGVEMSRVELAGALTVMYKWDGESLGANMNAMFQNGRLISKAQYGLK